MAINIVDFATSLEANMQMTASTRRLLLLLNYDRRQWTCEISGRRLGLRDRAKERDAYLLLQQPLLLVGIA